MTVKLIKRSEAVQESGKQEEPVSTPRQLVSTAQAWVEEYKARKAVARLSFEALMRQA